MKGIISSYKNIVFAYLLFSGATHLRAQVVAQSTFDAGTDGWGANNSTSPPVHVADGGNPGGYISVTDQGSGEPWYFTAPPKFLGNVTAAYNQSLRFDLRALRSDTASLSAPDIIMSGGGLTIVYAITPPGSTWTSYFIPVHEAAG